MADWPNAPTLISSDLAPPYPPMPPSHIIFPSTPGSKRDALALVFTPPVAPSLIHALSRLSQRAPWLSKNVLLLQPTSPLHLSQLLDDYADKAGPIRQALVFNTSGSATLVLPHGLNGHLPNLDLVNVAVRALGQQNKPPTTPPLPAPLVPRSHRHLLSFALHSAFGPSGWHAVLLARQIDALTIQAPPSLALASSVETIIRALSNLEEKLHHSYYFYLLINSNTFVSVEEYVWPMLLFLSPLALRVLHLCVFHPSLSHLLSALCLYALFSLLGLVAFLAAPTYSLYLPLLLLVATPLPAAALTMPSDYLLAVAALMLFLALAALAILDFALSLCAAFITVPLLLLTRPPTLASLPLPLALLALTSPPALFDIALPLLPLHPDFFPPSLSPLARLAYASAHHGSILLPLYSLVLFPAHLACLFVLSGHLPSLPPLLAVIPPLAQIGGSHENVTFVAGCVAKAEVDPEQFDTEVALYRASIKDPLASVMPSLIQVNNSVKPRIMLLEDLTRLVSKDPTLQPVAIMDIKLGLRSFRQDAPNKPKPEYFAKYAEFTHNMDAATIASLWASVAHVWWKPPLSPSSASTPLTSDISRRLSSNDSSLASLSRLPSLLGLDPTESKLLDPISTYAARPLQPPSLDGEVLGKRDYLLFRDASTTSSAHGFRLTACSGPGRNVSQSEARLISSLNDFKAVAKAFCQSNPVILKSFAADIAKCLQACSLSPTFARHDFVGTSLLLLFSPATHKTAVRWIDFANVTAPPSTDLNGIQRGLGNLISLFESLADEC